MPYLHYIPNQYRNFFTNDQNSGQTAHEQESTYEQNTYFESSSDPLPSSASELDRTIDSFNYKVADQLINTLPVSLMSAADNWFGRPYIQSIMIAGGLISDLVKAFIQNADWTEAVSQAMDAFANAYLTTIQALIMSEDGQALMRLFIPFLTQYLPAQVRQGIELTGEASLSISGYFPQLCWPEYLLLLACYIVWRINRRPSPEPQTLAGRLFSQLPNYFSMAKYLTKLLQLFSPLTPASYMSGAAQSESLMENRSDYITDNHPNRAGTAVDSVTGGSIEWCGSGQCIANSGYEIHKLPVPEADAVNDNLTAGASQHPDKSAIPVQEYLMSHEMAQGHDRWCELHTDDGYISRKETHWHHVTGFISQDEKAWTELPDKTRQRINIITGHAAEPVSHRTNPLFSPLLHSKNNIAGPDVNQILTTLTLQNRPFRGLYIELIDQAMPVPGSRVLQDADVKTHHAAESTTYAARYSFFLSEQNGQSVQLLQRTREVLSQKQYSQLRQIMDLAGPDNLSLSRFAASEHSPAGLRQIVDILSHYPITAPVRDKSNRAEIMKSANNVPEQVSLLTFTPSTKVAKESIGASKLLWKIPELMLAGLTSCYAGGSKLYLLALPLMIIRDNAAEARSFSSDAYVDSDYEGGNPQEFNEYNSVSEENNENVDFHKLYFSSAEAIANAFPYELFPDDIKKALYSQAFKAVTKFQSEDSIEAKDFFTELYILITDEIYNFNEEKDNPDWKQYFALSLKLLEKRILYGFGKDILKHIIEEAGLDEYYNMKYNFEMASIFYKAIELMNIDILNETIDFFNKEGSAASSGITEENKYYIEKLKHTDSQNHSTNTLKYYLYKNYIEIIGILINSAFNKDIKAVKIAQLLQMNIIYNFFLDLEKGEYNVVDKISLFKQLDMNTVPDSLVDVDIFSKAYARQLYKSLNKIRYKKSEEDAEFWLDELYDELEDFISMNEFKVGNVEKIINDFIVKLEKDMNSIYFVYLKHLFNDDDSAASEAYEKMKKMRYQLEALNEDANTQSKFINIIKEAKIEGTPRSVKESSELQIQRAQVYALNLIRMSQGQEPLNFNAALREYITISNDDANDDDLMLYTIASYIWFIRKDAARSNADILFPVQQFFFRDLLQDYNDELTYLQKVRDKKLNYNSISTIKSRTKIGDLHGFYNQFINYTNNDLDKEASAISSVALMKADVDILSQNSHARITSSYNLFVHQHRWQYFAIKPHQYDNPFGRITFIKVPSDKTYIVLTVGGETRIIKGNDSEDNSSRIDEVESNFKYKSNENPDYDITPDIRFLWPGKLPFNKPRPAHVQIKSYHSKYRLTRIRNNKKGKMKDLVKDETKNALIELAEILKSSKRDNTWWEMIFHMLPFFEVLQREYYDPTYEASFEDYIIDILDVTITIMTLGASLLSITAKMMSVILKLRKIMIGNGMTHKPATSLALKIAARQFPSLAKEMLKMTVQEAASFLNPIPFTDKLVGKIHSNVHKKVLMRRNMPTSDSSLDSIINNLIETDRNSVFAPQIIPDIQDARDPGKSFREGGRCINGKAFPEFETAQIIMVEENVYDGAQGFISLGKSDVINIPNDMVKGLAEEMYLKFEQATSNFAKTLPEIRKKIRNKDPDIIFNLRKILPEGISDSLLNNFLNDLEKHAMQMGIAARKFKENNYDSLWLVYNKNNAGESYYLDPMKRMFIDIEASQDPKLLWLHESSHLQKDTKDLFYIPRENIISDNLFIDFITSMGSDWARVPDDVFKGFIEFFCKPQNGNYFDRFNQIMKNQAKQKDMISKNTVEELFFDMHQQQKEDFFDFIIDSLSNDKELFLNMLLDNADSVAHIFANLLKIQ